MYRILIVDDEAIERRGLNKILKTQFGDIVDVFEAEGGKEAIDISALQKPDIVFMDMKMPGMDGIQTIEAIQKISPGSKFIVVSAYDSFNYAQKAINIDVFDYLLKPVRRKNIIDQVERLIEIKDNEIVKMKSELELKNKLNEMLPLIENEMVQSIVINDSYRKDTIKKLDFLKFKGENCFGIIIDFYEEDFALIEDELEKNFTKKKIEEDVSLTIKEQFSSLIGNLISNRIIAFVDLDENLDSLEARTFIVEFFRRLREYIKSASGIRSKIGIGGLYHSIENLNQSYKEAIVAVKYNSITAKVIHFEDINIDNTYKEYYPIDLERQLIEKIQLGFLEEARKSYDQLMDWIFCNVNENPRRKLYLIELRGVINRTLSEKLLDDYKPISFDISISSYVEIEDLYNLRDHMYSHIKECLERLNIKREEQYDYVIEQAKSYIEENYYKDINLEDVAEFMNFSSYYFSKMFKQQTGINFIDFLTNIRIEKAKLLLTDTELSMKEIASRVGYRDPNYFSRVFKKVTELNPREYREKILNS